MTVSEFLTTHGWQFVRDEKLTMGNREYKRGVYRFNGREALASQALQEVWQALGMPQEPGHAVIYHEPAELSEDEKERLRIQGLF